MKFVNMF